MFQTASGSVPAPLYTELLAAYLAEGELIRLISSHLPSCTNLVLQGLICRAKFLWKRIPAASKQDGELPRVWAIGKGEQGNELEVLNF